MLKSVSPPPFNKGVVLTVLCIFVCPQIAGNKQRNNEKEALLV